MSVDTVCEADRCQATGHHLVARPWGHPLWLCDRCAEELCALAQPHRPSWPERFVTWAVFAVAFGLWATGVAMVATNVHLDAGLAWAAWALIATGTVLGVWRLGVHLDRQEDR